MAAPNLLTGEGLNKTSKKQVQTKKTLETMKKVIVINAKIAQFGEDFSTLCVLNAHQEVEQYSKTLTKQITEFCSDNDVKVTEEQVREIAETLAWSDYAETPEGELLFTAATYAVL